MKPYAPGFRPLMDPTFFAYRRPLRGLGCLLSHNCVSTSTSATLDCRKDNPNLSSSHVPESTKPFWSSLEALCPLS